MYAAKNVAAYGSLIPVADSPTIVFKQGRECRVLAAGFGGEGPQGSSSLIDQPVAPAFGRGEDPLLPSIVGFQSREQCLYRFRINIAHEFADVLFLSSPGFMRFHAVRIAKRVAQPFVELEAVELFIG